MFFKLFLHQDRYILQCVTLVEEKHRRTFTLSKMGYSALKRVQANWTISSLVPGSCPPNWLHGKARISKPTNHNIGNCTQLSLNSTTDNWKLFNSMNNQQLDKINHSPYCHENRQVSNTRQRIHKSNRLKTHLGPCTSHRAGPTRCSWS